MALNFGGNQMFPQAGLYDDIGSIKERWQQEGSNVLNFLQLKSGGTGHTLVYTVPAGKVVYITQLHISCTANFDGAVSIEDNVTDLIYWGAALLTTGNQTVNMGTPLKFETTVRIWDNGTVGSAQFAIVGWEENSD